MTLTTQTSAALIDGKAWAERVLVEVADSVAQLEAEGTTPMPHFPQGFLKGIGGDCS